MLTETTVLSIRRRRRRKRMLYKHSKGFIRNSAGKRSVVEVKHTFNKGMDIRNRVINSKVVTKIVIAT